MLRALATRARSMPAPLALLLGVAAVLGFAWSLATAPLQGYDEDAHFAYVEHLAETGTLPKTVPDGLPFAEDEELALSSLDYRHMLQNLRARPPWTAVQERAFRRAESRLVPGARANGGGPNGLAKNPPLYYAYEAAAYWLTPGGTFFARLFVLRLAGVLLFVGCVAFAWGIGAELFRRTLPRVVTAGVVALQPVAGFASGIVNADVLLMTVWTAFLWLALRLVRLGPSWKRVLGLTAVAAASLLTHGRGLAIVPVLAVALAVAFVRHRPPRAHVLGGAGIAAAGTALALGAYRAITAGPGGGGLYGGEINLGNTAAFSVRQLVSSVWQFYLPKLHLMHGRLGPEYGYRQVFVETGFGTFGSNEIVVADWAFDLVQVGLALALIGVYTVAALRFGAVRARWAQLAVVLATGLSMLALLHLASYRALLGDGTNPLITGRYLLPLVGVLAAGLAGLVAALPRRAAPYLAVAILGSLTVLTLAGIGVSVQRFYV